MSGSEAAAGKKVVVKRLFFNVKLIGDIVKQVSHYTMKQRRNVICIIEKMVFQSTFEAETIFFPLCG